METWFHKYVEGHPQRGHAWRSGLLGENAWLDLVPVNIYPKWARTGNRKRLFCSNIKALARKKKTELNALPDDAVMVSPPVPEGISPITSDNKEEVITDKSGA